MLKQLYIQNFALIDTLDISFENGFSVITGETGAGKSIILGAIGLLLGQRADSKSVKTGAQKCTIEAHFDLSQYGMQTWFDENELDYEDECIIRRELTSAGKSRAFVNDTPTTLAVIRELGEMLIDVHSQHQNLLLQKEDFQLSTIDIIAHNTKELSAYKSQYLQLREARHKLEELRQEIEENATKAEFMRFQLNELTEANLTDGELEQLEEESEIASHTEDIKSALYAASELLSGDDANTIGNLKSALSHIDGITNKYPRTADISERLNSAYIELKDIAGEIENCVDDVDFDPERLQFVNDRIDRINTLLHKYHVSDVAELISQREQLSSAIANIDNADDCINELSAKVTQLTEETIALASKLTDTRLKAAKKVEEYIQKSLASLGMPNVRFEVEIKDSELSRNGKDNITFLFSANKGMSLRPVAEIASGGEIARVMLSLKAMISGAIKLPTIIFDEIDTGVSGKIAEKMADIMCEMANNNRQVISITHLPQIASKGSNHYKVEKYDEGDRTISAMRQLTTEERINEIAQMLSGSSITEAAISNARELLGA